MSQADRYTRTAVWLHWLIALAVLAQIAFGYYLQEIPRGTPDRTVFVNFHKSTGMLIGMLVLIRIAWRLSHTPPPLPAALPAWERAAARASHFLLYACMIVMPLAGYTASNFSKFGVNLFNRWLLPPWGADDRQIYALFNSTHRVAAVIFVVLISVHALAGVRHWFRHREIFLRMWIR